jgi:class 3 adenylate cyclase
MRPTSAGDLLMTDEPRADIAQAALDRHDWRQAYDALAAGDERGELSLDELELFAQSAWWLGMLPAAIDARERAYAAATKSGDLIAAVTAAIQLGRDNLFRNALPVGEAWLNRAASLLEGVPENLGHGWLAATRAFHASLDGDAERSLAQADLAEGIGKRLGDADLRFFSMSAKGAALVALGRVDEGLALIDEATVAAVGGELHPQTAGGICCTSIESCAALGEWQRATEWTDAQDRWCKREGISGFPGMCRLFRSEIKRLRGDWPGAEAEARHATDELKGFMPAGVGGALYQIGEIRLARGDLAEAEAVLGRAHAIGYDPEPALALLRLAQGRTAEASASIRHALAEPSKTPAWRAPPGSDLYRLPMLAAQVEIELAAGDVATARAAADQMTAMAKTYTTAPIRAAAAMGVGAVLLAEGDPAGAAEELRRGLDAWLEFDAPFEGARTRVHLAEAYASMGDEDRARMELQSARTVLERMGAQLELHRAEALEARIGTGAVPHSATERETKTFVFTDIVDSTRLAELLGDEAWNGLLHWHDDALRAVAADLEGTEVKRTGDGFFLTFNDAGRAIEAAVRIQRRLADHRREQGFAPSVRIGMHRSEATRSGADYTGIGVNEAARVCAAAGSGEILVTAEALSTAGRGFPQSGRRTLELKGIATPVEVVSIDWR